jgi:PAS domain S-box-containing protein
MADTTDTSETTHIVIHNGVITFVGANCFDIVGQPPGYFQGRHVHELMHPEDQVRLNNVFRPGWTGRFSEHFRVRNASGEWTWRRADGVRTVDESGEPHTVMELRHAEGPEKSP